MKPLALLSVIFSLIALTGCTTIKRYSSATLVGEDPSLVSVDLFGYTLYPDENEGQARTLWDLNASAQDNLLNILNKRYPENEWFISSLSNSYVSADAEYRLSTDHTSRDLRLILSVSKKRDYSNIGMGSKAGNPAADRIEYLKFRITLPDSINIRFKGWNRYSTEYADIDIAGVSFNRSIDLGAETDLSWTENYPKGSQSINAGSNLNLKEDQKIRYRYLKLNGKINEKEIEIEEEGTRETDLTGNITADLSLDFGSFRERVFVPVIINMPERNPVMTLQGIDMYVPDINNDADDVVADLEIEFLYRHVKKGSNTFQEWDDHVEYYTGKKVKKITLIKNEDYLPPIHAISKGIDKNDLLMVRSDNGNWYTLKFRNYREATIFLDWIKRSAETATNLDQPIMAGKDKLYINSEELSPKLFTSNNEFQVVPYYK